MKGIVDRVAYNPDMNFHDTMLVPDDSFVCPRLWQRICITSSGNYLKCPSDFRMEEILGNINDYSVKESWDVLQENQRQMHLAGRKKEGKVCNKCHHGASKKKVSLSIEGKSREDYSYNYNKEFKGHGLKEHALKVDQKMIKTGEEYERRT